MTAGLWKAMIKTYRLLNCFLLSDHSIKMLDLVNEGFNVKYGVTKLTPTVGKYRVFLLSNCTTLHGTKRE